MPYADPEVRREAARRLGREWYAKNRESTLARSKASKARKQAWMDSLKEGTPCAQCGHSYPPRAMDWHHVRGAKLFSVGNAAGQASRKAILAEIAKCELLCAVCHRLVPGTYARA